CGRVLDTCANPRVDDDCDGATDEDEPPGNLTSCHTCPGATETCNGIDDDCDGTVDEDHALNPGRPFSICPTACNSNVVCGSGVGLCHTGHFNCINGQLDTTTCVGAQGPRPEVCDLQDNDCDGIVDNPEDLKRSCTTPYGMVGICQPGVQFCA